jgi:hypothetical protein
VHFGEILKLAWVLVRGVAANGWVTWRVLIRPCAQCVVAHCRVCSGAVRIVKSLKLISCVQVWRSPFDTFGLISACRPPLLDHHLSLHWQPATQRSKHAVYTAEANCWERIAKISDLLGANLWWCEEWCLARALAGVLLSWLGRQLLALKILADVCPLLEAKHLKGVDQYDHKRWK